MDAGAFTTHERECACGAVLMFHCRAGTGASIGRKVGRCPQCGAEKELPDTVLKTFEKVEGQWVER